MAITHEQEQYYDALDEVFALPGWKKIIEEAKAQIYQNQSDALECADWAAVCELRGKSLSLVDLINLEAVSLMQRQQLEEPDDDADL